MSKSTNPFKSVIETAAENLQSLGAVNLAAIFLALADDKEKLDAKDNIRALIYRNKPLSVFDMPESEYGAFRRDAENHRIVSSAIVDNRFPDIVSVIILSEDIPRVKEIFDEASYDTSNIVLDIESKNQFARLRSDNRYAKGGRMSMQRKITIPTRTKPSVRATIIRYRQAIDEKMNPKPERQSQSWREIIAGNV
jgi:hypothetical protein